MSKALTNVQPRTFGDYFETKTNSIGFLRVVLATTVIIHHSFTLRHGWNSDPLWRLTNQLDLGSLAVNSFLVLSGFLIAASFQKTNNVVRYLWARALRLYPAFWACLLVSALVLAPLAWLIERGTLAGYFPDSGTSAITYVVANWSLWIRQNEIEGLFRAHSSRYFNGSLWTLFLEAGCYLLVPLVAYAGGLRKKRWLVLVGWAALCLWFLIDLFQVQPFARPLRMFSLMKVGIYFATGVLCYAYRDVIPLSWKLLLIAFALLLLSVPLHFAAAASLIAVPYFLLWCAFKLPFINWEGNVDLSYGIYVYAYPIQQLLIAVWPGIHSIVLMLLAMLIVTPIAMLSWKYIEQPALRLKSASVPVLPILKTTRAD